MIAWLPKIEIKVLTINVKMGDDEEDEKAYFVTPQTPCNAKFLAIAK